MLKNLNINISGLKPSATLAINEKSLDLLHEGKEIFRLGLGQSPFPVPESVVSALRAHASEKDYLPVSGLPALREAVAGHLNRGRGTSFHTDNILIGPGSKELLFILQMAFHGELLLPAPSWVSYAPQAELLGLNVQWLPTTMDNGWRLQPEVLDDFCQSNGKHPRLLILNYPNNPMGTSYSDEWLAELAVVARKHELLVVADEIYWELSFDDNPGSLARHYPEGTILSTGLSKWCGAGGWRLGAFAFPDALATLRNAMTTIASETYSAVSAPVQFAAVTAFTGSAELDAYLHHSRRVMQFILSFYENALRDVGIRCAPPEGGFYLMPDFSGFRVELEESGITSGSLLANRILQDTGIASLPGSDFGLPDDSLILRIALVDFDGAAALAASGFMTSERPLDASFLANHAPALNKALSRLLEWISGIR
ncbi:MAG: aminotransferase class I/II-fold pyridoxal phosphate-dependent enzyme [Woeseia sp.]